MEVWLMIAEMTARSQITLPDEIIEYLGLSEGDKFEVIGRDGGVFLCPAVEYPKTKLKQISDIIEEHEKNSATVFDNAEDMFRYIGINLEDSDV
jgi:AbrB family looped-hinge helix DNA binding protein